MKNIQDDQQRDLDRLRELLLGQQSEKLEKLVKRLENKEQFSDEIAQILPQAIRKSVENSNELSDAMLPTVEENVRLSIKRDINKFADALFPVIGPAIRKSIAETIRQMLQTFNQALENSLSWQGVKWRFESFRTGVPFAQIVMLNSLVYRVEQVFLIHRKTGLLLNHLEIEDKQYQDVDMVSSMLSAIGDFVGDSFDIENRQALDSIQVGDFSIWMEHGPEAVLAVAIRGDASNSLRTKMKEILEKIQLEYSESLFEFKGDIKPFVTTEEILLSCMQTRYKTPRKKSSSKTRLIWLVIFIALLFWLFSYIHSSMQQNDYIAMLDKEQGYVVTQVTYNDGKIIIKGLRDPLSRQPEKLLEESSLDAAEVQHQFEPYLSLQSEFVKQRINKSLNPPETVSLEVNNGLLIVRGEASEDWINFFNRRISSIAGINQIDSSGLKNETFDGAVFNPPETVTIKLQDEILKVMGKADNDWINSLSVATKNHANIDKVDLSQLINMDKEALKEDINHLENEKIFFEMASSSDLDEDVVLKRVVPTLKKIIANAEKLSQDLKVIIQGSSDSVGNFQDNMALSLKRAEYVAQYLAANGINQKYLLIKGIEAPLKKEGSVTERRFNRRVVFKVVIK